MVRSTEAQLTMLVVHAKDRHGFYVALVPASLDAAEVDSNLRELGIDPTQVYELGGWQTSTGNVATAFVPYPPSN